MSKPLWEIGPAKLANGCDATIHQFCEKRRKYIGEWEGMFTWRRYAAEWNVAGHHTVSGVGNPLLNLAPPHREIRPFEVTEGHTLR